LSKAGIDACPKLSDGKLTNGKLTNADRIACRIVRPFRKEGEKEADIAGMRPC
jgi:hypothetical protein